MRFQANIRGVVREIVGHSDIEVTMTIYVHVSLDEKRKTLAKIGEASDNAVAVTVAVNGPIGGRRPEHRRSSEVVVRGGVEPPTFRFSGGRSYQLSYLTAAAAISRKLATAERS